MPELTSLVGDPDGAREGDLLGCQSHMDTRNELRLRVLQMRLIKQMYPILLLMFLPP